MGYSTLVQSLSIYPEKKMGLKYCKYPLREDVKISYLKGKFWSSDQRSSLQADVASTPAACILFVLFPYFHQDVCNFLHAVPESHEGESQEQPQGSSHLCYEGGQTVQQLLSLHKGEGGDVPHIDFSAI